MHINGLQSTCDLISLSLASFIQHMTCCSNTDGDPRDGCSDSLYNTYNKTDSISLSPVNFFFGRKQNPKTSQPALMKKYCAAASSHWLQWKALWLMRSAQIQQVNCRLLIPFFLLKPRKHRCKEIRSLFLMDISCS